MSSLLGDCKNFIHLWEPSSGTSWNVDAAPFVGHSASVEDLQVYSNSELSHFLQTNQILATAKFEFMQWSPTEPHVFASSSVDGNIAIWDVRSGKSPAAYFKAHNADVNVISWNR